MQRNYKKEYESQKQNYDCIRANIKKELGQKLRIKLMQEKITIAKWISENATKYINE